MVPAYVWKKNACRTENYYGWGDKTGSMNRAQSRFHHVNTDVWMGRITPDPLYQAITFFWLPQRHRLGVFLITTYAELWIRQGIARTFPSAPQVARDQLLFFSPAPTPRK